MAFAPIEAVKDLLTGSIWDKFKEMIEPYALVNSIILIVLNLALVYPAMGDLANDGFLGALSKASNEWKLAVGTIALFIGSYLINHLSTFSLDLASGEFFRGSPVIGKLLNERQKKIYSELTNQSGMEIKKDGDRIKKDLAAFRLAYDFPFEKNELGLTTLSNILLNPPSYIAHQYGASMQLAWPIIQENLADDDKTLKTLQGHWNSLMFFTSLFGVLTLVGVEIIFVTALSGGKLDIPQLLILLAFIALCLAASLDKARQWARGMRRLFDAHIKDVFTDLGLEALKDITPASKDYKTYWMDILGWLIYGAMGKIGDQQYTPKETWYKKSEVAPSETWPKIKRPDFLHVEPLPKFVHGELTTKRDGNTHVCIEKSVEYLFAITNTSTGENPLSGNEAYLLVQDEGVTPPDTVIGRLIRQKASGSSTGFDEIDVKGKRQSGRPSSVLFPLGNIPPGHSRILRYSFDSALAEVTINKSPKNVVLGKDAAGMYYVEASLDEANRKQAVDFAIELVDDKDLKLSPYIELSPSPQAAYPPKGEISSDGRTGRWRFTLQPKQPVKIHIDLLSK